MKTKVVGRVRVPHKDYVQSLESNTDLEDEIKKLKKMGYKLKDIKYRTVNDGDMIEFYVEE